MLRSDTADPPPLRSPLLAAAEVQDDLLVSSNDLERLQRLLDDASESLLRHFHAISDRLGRSLQHVPDGQPALNEALTHVAGAITAMQFQDMASQLINHTNLRLKACADRLANEAMGDDEDGPGIPAVAPLRPNPVTQDEMDAGSIELF